MSAQISLVALRSQDDRCRRQVMSIDEAKAYADVVRALVEAVEATELVAQDEGCCPLCWEGSVSRTPAVEHEPHCPLARFKDFGAE